MKFSQGLMAFMAMFAAIHGVQAQATARVQPQAGTKMSPEKLSRARQLIRCYITLNAGAESVTHQGEREISKNMALMLARQAVELGSSEAQVEEWSQEFVKQTEYAYAEDNSAPNKVRDYSFLPKETEICKKLHGELLDLLFEPATKESTVVPAP